ncbi:hypothetical protein ACL1BK_06500 [Corynebacterium striatum]
MPTDVTFPLLDAERAAALLDSAKLFSPEDGFPASEFEEITAGIDRVIVDGRFTGAVEDAQPAADLLEAHSLLVASLLDDSEPTDSTNGLLIAGIGILTGKPDLASRGYALLADEFMKLEEFENARAFGEKAAFAGNSSILTELNELEKRKATEQAEREAEETAAAQAAAAPETNIHPVATPNETADSDEAGAQSLAQILAGLRTRLDAAKSGDAQSHASEFVAINHAVLNSAFAGPLQVTAPTTSLDSSANTELKEALTILLESAVGALWASTSDEAREVVAEESYKILRRNHKRREYLELPIAMLARFYEDAARNITDPSGIIRAQFYADAAQEHARDGNEERELEMLLKQVVLGLMQSGLSEAHDILASRYVSALKHTGLSVAAKWTVLFSETLRTEANNLYKSTQILMDFLERHPVELAQTPADFNGLGEVAELLGDRYALANDADSARQRYHFAYNLFSAAGNDDAMASLAKKA